MVWRLVSVAGQVVLGGVGWRVATGVAVVRCCRLSRHGPAGSRSSVARLLGVAGRGSYGQWGKDAGAAAQVDGCDIKDDAVARVGGFHPGERDVSCGMRSYSEPS